MNCGSAECTINWGCSANIARRSVVPLRRQPVLRTGEDPDSISDEIRSISKFVAKSFDFILVHLLNFSTSQISVQFNIACLAAGGI